MELFKDRKVLKYFGLGFALALICVSLFWGTVAVSDTPKFCGSCHAMESYTHTWNASTHKQFNCGECHIPHDNLVDKYYVKGQSGLRDVYHETMRDYPENIQIKADSLEVLTDNCIRCHESTIADTSLMEQNSDCIQCHRGLVHDKRKIEGGIIIE